MLPVLRTSVTMDAEGCLQPIRQLTTREELAAAAAAGGWDPGRRPTQRHLLLSSPHPFRRVSIGYPGRSCSCCMGWCCRLLASVDAHASAQLQDCMAPWRNMPWILSPMQPTTLQLPPGSTNPVSPGPCSTLSVMPLFAGIAVQRTLQDTFTTIFCF